MDFYCKPCNRYFKEEKDLNAHIASRIHRCDDCDRFFSTAKAVKAHIRDSHRPRQGAARKNTQDKAQPTSATSAEISSAANAQAARKKTEQNKAQPTSAASAEIASATNAQAARKKTQQNKAQPTSAASAEISSATNAQAARKKNQNKAQPTSATSAEIPSAASARTATPLDRFFRSFKKFKYNPQDPPAQAYQNLRRLYGWDRGDRAQKEAWRRYQQALMEEVKVWFGNEGDIDAWHALCRALGIKKLPPTIEDCRKRVRDTHVNIVDLIEWGRDGSERETVTIFKSRKELAEYSIQTGKIFSKFELRNDADETNIVIRHLLRHIFTDHLSRRALGS